MAACNPHRCPNKDNCPALVLSRTFGDQIPPNVLEKPKGCLFSISLGPTRAAVSAGVEWLSAAVL